MAGLDGGRCRGPTPCPQVIWRASSEGDTQGLEAAVPSFLDPGRVIGASETSRKRQKFQAQKTVLGSLKGKMGRRGHVWPTADDPSTVVIASLVFSLSFMVGQVLPHPFYRWGVEAQGKQLLQ